MLRVKWVTWWPAPYWIERFNMLAESPEIDLSVVYLSAKTSHYDWSLREDSMEFNHFSLSDGVSKAGQSVKFILNLPHPFKLLGGKFDVLITGYSDASCIIAVFLCWLTRKDYYVFVANTAKNERKKTILREMIKSAVFNAAKGVLATGRDHREYAMQYTGEDKIHVIGNPSTDYAEHYDDLLNKRKDCRDEFGWDDYVVLLYVGRISVEKGLSHLIEAVAGAHNCSDVKIKLVIVGSGGLEGELLRCIEDNEIDAACMGFADKLLLAKYYIAADIFVLPSKTEAWGLVVNEAMQFGLPIVVSDRVGCASTLLANGENGYIYSYNNVSELSKCICKLADSEELRKSMGLTSRKIIMDHSIEKWVSSVVEAIN